MTPQPRAPLARALLVVLSLALLGGCRFAGVVATMAVGERRPRKIEHDIPIGNEHGEVQVTRTVTTPPAFCKELVFSVAEPAVERWGSPQ